jgi:hypothetical protein
MPTIRQLTINHKGLEIEVDVTYFEPARAMPFAQTPDSPGYDDEGSPGEVEFEVTGVSVDCEQTVIESGGIQFDDDEELCDKVFQEMSS